MKLPASSRDRPSVVCVRSLVPKLKNSAFSAISSARERRARQLDHRADAGTARRRRVSSHDLGHARATISSCISSSSRSVPTSGIMISGSTVLAFLLHRDGGLEDRPRLHLVDLGIGDAEPAAAVAEHRVELVQPRRRARAPSPTSLADRLRRARRCPRRSCGRNSCSGGSSRRIVTGRPSIARKSPSKSSRWIGSSLASALRAALARRRPGSSRAPRRCARRRRTCARCGTGRCPRRRSARAACARRRRVGVGAHARAARTSSAQPISSAKSPGQLRLASVGTSPSDRPRR